LLRPLPRWFLTFVTIFHFFDIVVPETGLSAVQRAVFGQEGRFPQLLLFDRVGQSIDSILTSVASEHEPCQTANAVGGIIQGTSRCACPAASRATSNACDLALPPDFHLSAASLHLVLVQGEEQCVLDDDLKELAHFGFSSGCTLQITRA
jgi:hypothetical protein